MICTVCANSASTLCSGCRDAPAYQTDEVVNTAYCSRACQTAHWKTHKTACNARQKRKKLLCIAKTLKAAFLAYRECTFDLDIRTIELKGNVLHLQMNTAGPRRDTVFKLPNDIPLQHKEAALADCQCSCAKSLLGPLARHLLSGVCLSLHEQEFKIGHPIFSIVRGQAAQSNVSQGHTVLVVSLHNKEQWIIDSAGCQFGFQDVLVPYDRYVKEKRCESTGHTVAYGFTETSDVDLYLTMPMMTAHPAMRENLIKERSNRLRFAQFVDEEIKRQRLSGLLAVSGSGFDVQLAGFINDLKTYLAG